MDPQEPKGYEVVFDATGALLEEQKHALTESDALKVLRFFALFGTLDEKAQVCWTAEKPKGEPRRFTLRIDECSVPGRLEVLVQPDGNLNVTLDQRLKEGGAQKPGKLEGRFQLTEGQAALPATLVPAKPKVPQTAGGTGTEGQPAEEVIPEEVMRKIRRLIRATLSEDGEERDEGWKQLRNMGNLAVPGLAAVARHKDTTPEMLDSLMIALGDSKDPRAGPALAGLLQSTNPLVKQGAARAIGDSGYKDAVAGLERLASDPTEEEEVRLFAAIAAAKFKSDAGYDALKFLATSERPATRTRSVFALGKYGGKPFVSVLAAALDDSEAVVRADAVEALRLVGGDEAKVALARAMSDTDHRVRGAALAGLRGLTDQQPGPILVSALASPDVKVRAAVAKALGDLGYKESVADVEKLLADTDERVRLQAALSAAKLGSGPALVTLKELLKSQATDVRAKALVGLGKQGGETQLEAIAEALKDADGKVRLAAVEALSLIGDKGVLRLMDALTAEDVLVREAAVESLQALTGQEIGADPAAWRDWWKKNKETTP
jgi:HEAT repeat protein